MMTDPWFAAQPHRRLHHHEVDADRQAREPDVARDRARLEERGDRPPQPGALGPIERLLRKAEVASASPADLDEDEFSRRARVDGDDVKLSVPGADVPAEDPPARLHEPDGDQLLGFITEPPGRGGQTPIPIARITASWVSNLARDSPGTCPRLTR